MQLLKHLGLIPKTREERNGDDSPLGTLVLCLCPPLPTQTIAIQPGSSRQIFRYDYRRKGLDFSSNASLAGSIPFETRKEAGGTYVPITLQSNGERLQMLLDTGTNDIMLFKPCLRGGLQQLPVQGKDFNLNAGGRDSLAPPRGFIGNSQMESGG